MTYSEEPAPLMPDPHSDDVSRNLNLSSGIGRTTPPGERADAALGDFAADLDLSVGMGATQAGQDDENALALTAGTLLANRYEVKSRLGAGGMGAVYRVYDRLQERDVALKVMLPSLLSKPKAVQRFANEAKLMLNLAHDGIVRVYDVGLDRQRGLRFFTMECLEGQSLRQWLQARAEDGVDPKDALEITGQVLEALQYAHRTTIHRDLKPENVFVVAGDEVRVKILDFGIAKIHTGSDFTRTNMALGTVDYMAPEQRRDAATVDAGADLYSVCVMLYEMLTGKLPVGRFKTPTEERKALPKQFDEVVLTGLEPESKDRFASAQNLLSEVHAIRSLLDVGRQKRSPYGLLVPVVLLALAGCGAAWAWQAGLISTSSTQPRADESKVRVADASAAPPERGAASAEGEDLENEGGPVSPPPTAILVLSPTDGVVLKGYKVEVRGHVEGEGVDQVRVNGVATAVGSNRAFAITIALEEGKNEIPVEADGVKPTVATVFADNERPRIVIDPSIVDTVTSEANPLIHGKVFDDHPDRVTIDGVATPIAEDGRFEGRAELHLEGDNEIEVAAWDAAGNEERGEVTVTLDTKPPVIVITAPSTDLRTNADSLRVTGTVSDPHLDWVSLNGARSQAQDGRFDLPWLLTNEGLDEAVIEAADRAGNRATQRVTLAVDRTKPTLEISVPGEVDGDSVRIVVTADEALREARAGGTPLTVSGHGASGRIPLLEAGLEVLVRATDLAGNVGVGSFRVTRKAKKASLELSHHASPARPGEPFYLHYAVSNTGSVDLTNTVIRQRLPAGIKTVDGESEVVINVGRLGPGSVQHRVEVRGEVGGYTCEATVTADGELAVAVTIDFAVEPAKAESARREPASAVEGLRKAAELGGAGAQNNLGVAYWRGQGVPQDDAKAVEWYRKAANQGLADAQDNLGYAYAFGRGIQQDYTRAVEWYRKAAEQGHANAQLKLGFAYDQGQGVTRDRAMAVVWYRKAAKQGLAAAQFNLALEFAEGKVATQDYSKAVEWYRKAADQGLAEAQLNLGAAYEAGRGIQQDSVKAVEWYRLAADQGYAMAQHNLGLAYVNGQGVARDPAMAVVWYRKAASQGYTSAQLNLGAAYWNGQGVPQDDTRAVEWFRKAAKQGSANAQFNLGLAYRSGRGVTEDHREAAVWYRKAAAQGHEDARKNLRILEKARR